MPETGATAIVAGNLAARALRDCGGALKPLPEFPDAPYRLAGDTVVWIGRVGPMHPRAVFADAACATLKAAALTPCAPLPNAAVRPTACRSAFARLLSAIAADAPNTGLAPMLRNEIPAFPLHLRVAQARAAATAAHEGDARAFVAPALQLLGAGPGLTPSGDDFVGAMLFARLHLGETDAAWQAAAATLRCAAPERTHRIGAALFDDLATGESFLPLHDLVAAAHADVPTMTLLSLARAVTAIGHSSGWDMLTGLVAATAGLPEHRTTH